MLDRGGGETEGEMTGRGVIETKGEVTGRGVIEAKGEVTGRGVIEAKGEVTGRGVIKEGVGVGLKPESDDIDKVKNFIRLKKVSEAAQWEVGFNILDVALLEVGKVLWDRSCPLEERAKFWEAVQQWVLSKLLTRKRPSEEELTWLLEELDPWDLDPSEQEHLQSELRSLFGAVGSLLTITTNLDPAPQGKGLRLLPLLRPGLYWASYTSFTAKEREEQRRLHLLLCRHSREVSEKLSAGALDDLSRLVNELCLLRDECDEQTKEVVARIKWTLDRTGPEPKEEAGSHIPHEGTPLLTKRRPQPGLLESVPLLEQFEDSQTSLVSEREWTGCGIKALSRVTRFRAALGLAALLFIVTVGLALYIRVLQGSQSSEQSHTKGAQSDAAADGKDGDVLPPCGDWIWYRNKCFYFSDDEGTWTEAKDSCAALNSSLALIDTPKELDFMLRHVGFRDHWIGLQRETDQHWKWVNGTEFNNWFAVEDFSECAYLNYKNVKSTECYGKCKWICTKVSTYQQKRKKDP